MFVIYIVYMYRERDRVIYEHMHIKYIISEGIIETIKQFSLESCINEIDSYSLSFSN